MVNLHGTATGLNVMCYYRFICGHCSKQITWKLLHSTVPTIRSFRTWRIIKINCWLSIIPRITHWHSWEDFFVTLCRINIDFFLHMSPHPCATGINIPTTQMTICMQKFISMTICMQKFISTRCMKVVLKVMSEHVWKRVVNGQSCMVRPCVVMHARNVHACMVTHPRSLTQGQVFDHIIKIGYACSWVQMVMHGHDMNVVMPCRACKHTRAHTCTCRPPSQGHLCLPQATISCSSLAWHRHTPCAKPFPPKKGGGSYAPSKHHASFVSMHDRNQTKIQNSNDSRKCMVIPYAPPSSEDVLGTLSGLLWAQHHL